jgi:hypothetical protein
MEVREIYKKFNNIRPASYKFVRKAGIMQKKSPNGTSVQQKKRNNRNRNNQPITVEEVSTEEFYYGEFTPEQVVVLHQERLAQYLDGGLNSWGIMTSNSS